jgi:hypothetical protein
MFGKVHIQHNKIYKMQTNCPTFFNNDIANKIIGLLVSHTDLINLAQVDKYLNYLVNKTELYIAFIEFVHKVNIFKKYRNDINFINACALNCLTIAQYYYDYDRYTFEHSYSYFNNHYCHTTEIAFMKACENGQTKIAEWLFCETNSSWGKDIEPGISIEINDCNYYALNMACKNGHIETVKWLLQKSLKKNYSSTIIFIIQYFLTLA